MELSHDLWDAAGAAKWGQGANLLLATGTETVPMETQGHGKILRLLSDWEESVWERSVQGHRTGLAVWKLEGRWVSAQPLFTRCHLWKRALFYTTAIRLATAQGGILGCLTGESTSPCPWKGTGTVETPTKDAQGLAWNLNLEADRIEDFLAPTPCHNSGVLNCTCGPVGMSYHPKCGRGLHPANLTWD